MSTEEYQNDEASKAKLGKVLSLMEEFQGEKINSRLLERILKIQTLAKEVL
jgi:hypothetical protein